MIVSGIFRMFDYGTDKNLEVYGQVCLSYSINFFSNDQMTLWLNSNFMYTVHAYSLINNSFGCLQSLLFVIRVISNRLLVIKLFMNYFLFTQFAVDSPAVSPERYPSAGHTVLVWQGLAHTGRWFRLARGRVAERGLAAWGSPYGRLRASGLHLERSSAQTDLRPHRATI